MNFGFRSLFIFLIFFCFAQKAETHPWGGLAIDSDGNLYFTFICPLVDEDHYACVMKIDSFSVLSEVLKSSRSPSDIVLERTPNHTIYAAERTGSQSSYRNTLWKLNSDTFEQALSTINQSMFHIQAYALDNEGRIYFSKENQILVKENLSATPKLLIESDERISLIEWGPSEVLYFMARGNIYKYQNQKKQLIVENLRKPDPDNLPFQGANIFFDMVVDENENIYLAYYGNREILKVDTAGKVTSILSSEAPWSPHGIDIYNGEIYVLESTIGDGKWWKFWKEDVEITPRVRKLDSKGRVSTIYSYHAQ